jgi:hypothetical protein
MQTISPGIKDVVVKKVGVMSVARIYGAITGAFGLIAGGIFFLAALAGASLGGDQSSGFLGALFGVGAIVLFPILYGILGFIGGAIGAALYNAFAAMVGGVSVELE